MNKYKALFLINFTMVHSINYKSTTPYTNQTPHNTSVFEKIKDSIERLEHIPSKVDESANRIIELENAMDLLYDLLAISITTSIIGIFLPLLSIIGVFFMVLRCFNVINFNLYTKLSKKKILNKTATLEETQDSKKKRLFEEADSIK